MIKKYANKGFIQQLDGTYAVLIHPLNGYLEPEQLETIRRLTQQYGKAKLGYQSAFNREGGVEMNRLEVLFHVNESGRWQIVLVNIANFLNDVGQGNADIEVVANGEAVSIFGNRCLLAGGEGQGASCGTTANGSLVEQMKKLSEMGVNFIACRNALKGQSIEEDSLPNFLTVVPAGITEIARKQAEGYAYIKP